MLTKSDLKEIRNIIREETEAESQNIKTELQSDAKMNFVRLMGEIRSLNDRIKNIEIDIRKIQKDLKYAVNFLDKESLAITRRVEKIEKRLDISPLSS